MAYFTVNNGQYILLPITKIYILFSKKYPILVKNKYHVEWSKLSAF